MTNLKWMGDDPLPDQAISLDQDALLRGAIRRQLGFDMQVRVMANRCFVKTVESPYFTAGCSVGDPLTEKDIQKIVKACIRLKKRVEVAKSDG